MSKTYCRLASLFLILTALAVSLGAQCTGGGDLVASKTDSVSGTTTQGNGWTWTIVVTNLGPCDVGSGSGASILYDQLPSNLTYGMVTATPSAGATGAATCTIDGSFNLDCDQTSAVTIPPNEYFTITIPVNAPPVGTYVNPRGSSDPNGSGYCRANGPDGGSDSNFIAENDYSNDGCTDTVTVTAPAPPPAPPTAFKDHYFSNLDKGDSVINLGNDGSSGGSICVNVYTFAPDEQLISCCACPITPNGLASLSVQSDLISNVLTPAVPTSVTVKLIATNAAACNAAGLGGPAGSPVNGLDAWGSTLHAAPTTPVSYQVTETPFTPYTPGSSELVTEGADCFFIGRLGSGFGICKSCRLGGLGADKQ